jgi:hypothetical protein
MKFMLLIHEGTGPKPAPAEMEKIVGAHMKFATDIRASGKMMHGERLRPETDATRLSVKGGQRQTLDGPFAETKEVLGGFYLVDCASKAEAIEWAWKLPYRDGSFVEVRPVWEM